MGLIFEDSIVTTKSTIIRPLENNPPYGVRSSSYMHVWHPRVQEVAVASLNLRMQVS